MRSLPRSAILPLATVEGVEWIALAKDAWTPAMGEAGLANGLEGCEDWQDTVNAVANLDLVISVDTAVAHVAAALKGGPPVWLLITAVPDMRWMLKTERTPWYSRMKLYRQAIAGEWTPVIERVAADLQQEVYAHRMRDAA